MTELRQVIEDSSKINIPRLKNILNFFIENGWTIESKTQWHFKMKPPKKIGFSKP